MHPTKNDIHVITDVSAHKIQGNQTFGKQAAEQWSKLMQWAEGITWLVVCYTPCEHDFGNVICTFQAPTHS